MISINQLIADLEDIARTVGGHQPVKLFEGEITGVIMRNNGALIEIKLPKEITQAMQERDSANDECRELEDELSEIKAAAKDLLDKLGDGTAETEDEIRALDALI